MAHAANEKTRLRTEEAQMTRGQKIYVFTKLCLSQPERSHEAFYLSLKASEVFSMNV